MSNYVHRHPTSVLDLSKLHTMRFHCQVIHKNVNGRYYFIYTDTLRLVYNIRHHANIEWIMQNREF